MSNLQRRSPVNGPIVEQWTNATQAADPTPSGYTLFNANGTVASTRALNAVEVSQLAAMDATNTNATNQSAIQASITTHMGQVESWLAANPNGAVLTAAQTAFLARMLVGVGRIILGQTGTIGQTT